MNKRIKRQETVVEFKYFRILDILHNIGDFNWNWKTNEEHSREFFCTIDQIKINIEELFGKSTIHYVISIREEGTNDHCTLAIRRRIWNPFSYAFKLSRYIKKLFQRVIETKIHDETQMLSFLDRVNSLICKGK